MKHILLIIAILSTNAVYAQWAVTDVATQVNQIVIAKSQMLQATDQISTALNSLGVSSQMLESLQKQAERLKRINTTIKTIKKTTELLTLSYKITALYANLAKAIASDGAFNSKEIAMHTATMYSILANTLDMVADITNIVADNVFQMSDKERLDYIDKTHRQLNENYYQMQYNAYRIATYSHKSTIADQTMSDLNSFFNF